MSTCDLCDCISSVKTAWGDDLCPWHFEHGPTPDPCPNCSQDATPAGLPVAAVDERPSDATDAGAPPPASVATISPVAERVSPFHLLPPASATGDLTLADMVQAIEWCVTRAYDNDAPRGIIAAADGGLTLLRHLERGYHLATVPQ